MGAIFKIFLVLLACSILIGSGLSSWAISTNFVEQAVLDLAKTIGQSALTQVSDGLKERMGEQVINTRILLDQYYSNNYNRTQPQIITNAIWAHIRYFNNTFCSFAWGDINMYIGITHDIGQPFYLAYITPYDTFNKTALKYFSIGTNINDLSYYKVSNNYNVSSRDWYLPGISTPPTGAWIDIYFQGSSNELATSFAAPICTGSKCNGLVKNNMSLQFLSKLLQSVKVTGNAIKFVFEFGTGYLVGVSSGLITNPDNPSARLYLHESDQYEIREVAKSVFNGDYNKVVDDFQIIKISGKPYIVVHQLVQIDNLKWSSMLVLPLSDITDPVRSANLRALMIVSGAIAGTALLMLIIALFCIWLIRHREATVALAQAPNPDNITLVFTDIESSTEYWENDPEAMEDGLEIHNSIIRSQIRRNKGYEVKTQGDAFMVAFSNAANAVAFCLGTQMDLLTAHWPNEILEFNKCKEERSVDGRIIWRGLRVRMGVHCGQAKIVYDNLMKRADYFGPMVNMSARVASCSQGGQVLASLTIGELVSNCNDVQPLGEFYLKGIGTQALVQITHPEIKGRTFPMVGSLPKSVAFDVEETTSKRPRCRTCYGVTRCPNCDRPTRNNNNNSNSVLSRNSSQYKSFQKTPSIKS